MSAIQTFIRALFGSNGHAEAKYPDDQRREKPEEFERSGFLFSGRGIICFGAGLPRPANSRKGRILL